MSNRNKAVLIQFIDQIWNKGNLESAEQFVKFPYAIHHDPGDPWELQSLDLKAFQERVAHSRRIFPDLHFTLHEVISEEDKVAISWQLSGTQMEDIGGFSAIGKKVKVSGLTIYYFSDGKITGHWQVVDRLGFMQQQSPTHVNQPESGVR